MSDYITFPYEDEEGYREWLEKQPDIECPACRGYGGTYDAITFPDPKPCVHCEGKGRFSVGGDMMYPCPDCSGTGTEVVCYGMGEHGDCEQQACSHCDGTGKRRDVAPVECVQCKVATGPIAKIDAEHPGWLCPLCYGKLRDRDELPEHDPDDLEDGCGGTGILHCFCGGDFCACGDDEVECPGCEDCENADSEW